jgi:large subunit ribosomal protein L2
MGKRIKSQNRGRGSPTYRAPSHKFKAKLRHIKMKEGEKVTGKIVDILHDPARNAPIARVRLGVDEHFVLIPEGVSVGDEISFGRCEVKRGNALPLSEIPDGVPICDVESRPGSGGNFARASGTYAMLVTHEEKRTLIQLPSGKKKWLPSTCKATIGIVAGGGRTEKPFVKAGKKYHKMKSKAAKYPITRGVAMNPVDHPFGGGGHQHPGKPKTVARGAPHGRKVGSIAAKR